MRLPLTISALLLALTATLRATDFPTLKLALPDVPTAQGNGLPAIDLREHFAVTSIAGQVVQFRTTFGTTTGTFNLEMLPGAAPATVANFLTYVNGARYRNTNIHFSDTVAASTTRGTIRGGGWAVGNLFTHITTDPAIALESSLANTRGTIAMHRAPPAGATSEWFINTLDNGTRLPPGTNVNGFAVFGRVIGTGMTAVDAIHAVPVFNKQNPFGANFTKMPLVDYAGGNAQVLIGNQVILSAAEVVPIFPASAGQNAVVNFSVANTNSALVTATVSGSALQLVLAASQSGSADLTVTATDSNGNALQETFQLNVTPGTPEIAVEQPAGTELADAATLAFGTVVIGSPADLVFTIKNSGNGGLALTGTPKVTVDGADLGLFTVTAQPVSPVNAAGGSSTFTVRFAPVSSGAKTAALHIANDDSDEAPFDLTLTGTGNFAPMLTFPAGPLITEATGASGAVVSFAVTASDSEDGTPTPVVAPASGSTFAVGDTTVNVNVTDSQGAQTAGFFTVRVRDTVAPALTAPAAQVVDATGASGAIVNYPAAVATDVVGVASLTYSRDSGMNFPLGTTVVTVTAKDAANNTTTQTFTVSVGFLRPAATRVLEGARTGDPAPGAGTGGLPAGAVLKTFGPPAVSDARDLAARVAMLAGRSTLAGIYVEDLVGAGRLVAFQGGLVPGISAAGATFKSFLDPVLAPDASVAFAGAAQGGGVVGSDDAGVWTTAFGPALALALREGRETPGVSGARLKSVTSLSLRNGELLALLTLSATPAVVTAADDTVLLRLTVVITGGFTATIVLREGRELAGFTGSKIKTFSVLSPALGSPGHGRWHADGVIVAKVTLADARTLLVKIAPDGTVTTLLSTADLATPVDPAAKWKSFGLPAVGSAGTGFVVAAALQPNLGGVTAANDTVLLASTDGLVWSILAREGTAAPVTPAGPLYATFFDPVVNDAGRIAFLATLQGAGLKASTKTALFSGTSGAPLLVARLGSPASDAAGAPTTAVWSKFISHALPGGPGAGAIFLAETTGGVTTPKTKLALYAVDSQGTVRRLLRTGETLAGGTAPLTALTLLNAAPSAFGTTRSFNGTASLALVATFADKAQALLRVDVP